MTSLASRALLLAALAVSPASAQITITRADVVAQLTSSMTASEFDLADAAALPAVQALALRSGANQTWDLSGLDWESGAVSSIAPTAGPVPGSEFTALQSATHIAVAEEDGLTAYLFARVTADAYDALGSTSEDEDEIGNPMTVGVLFSPAKRVLPLPLTASSSWSSAYAFDVIPPFEGLEMSVTDASSVEGWGTLVTPAGSAAVLKVRTKTVITSTVEMPDSEPMVSVDSVYMVEFLSTSGSVASIELDGEGTAIGASYTVYARGGGTAGEAPPAAARALNLQLQSANPMRRGALAELAFALPAAADVRLDVFDVLGRHVAAHAAGVRSAGPQRVSVPTDGLPAGVYLVRLAAGAHAATLRLTVVS